MPEHASKQIWLLRHAQTEWSMNGRHTGSRSDIPLTEEGEASALLMKPVVSRHEFGLVLTSPLQRALRTAELAGMIDQAREDPDLLEWDYGDYEGVTTAEIRKDVPDWTIWSGTCPDGETGEDVAARARRVIDRALAADGDVGLIEECLIDDGQEQCMRLEAAIVNLRKLVGSDFTGLNT